MPRTALVLVGHGSHISPETAGIVCEQVDTLRALKVADEVTAAFWKETPSFHQVIDTLTAEDITIVPLFTARGYFTRTVIPAEIGLSGAVTLRDGRTLRYTPALGEHPYLSQVVREHVAAALRQSGANPSNVAVAIIGHGTRRSPESRGATMAQAEQVRDMAAEVVAVFLDDSPSIPDIFRLTSKPVLIAVPFFLALGSHTTIDVPGELGLPHGATVGQIEGQIVYYTPPVGVGGELTQAILELARDAGAPLSDPTSGSAWEGFPATGRDALIEAVRAAGWIEFGQLTLSLHEVRPTEIDLDREIVEFSDPAALRAHVRRDPFRPLATSTDLPRDWVVRIERRPMIHAAVETVYPGLVADWARRETLTVTPLAALAARQTGMYRQIDALSGERRAEVVAQVCGRCVRQPTWFDGRRDMLPCGEACNVWMSRALEGRMTVYLVGAGPGDPELITVKGLALLRRADVIIYDRLAPPELLREASPDAELIDAGKQPQKHRLDQAEINALIIDRARQGLTVVRLKGGDPFVFGRGGEEAIACRDAGIPFVVVPGVSSAIAVPAYAGIPVTQRNVSTAFTVLTGHEDPDGDTSMDYQALAKLGGTLVLLMGVAHLPRIVERLLAAGLAPETPAASIEWGTTERQRVVEATLSTIAQRAADLKPPTTTVIGAVAALGLHWFDPSG